MKGFFDTSVLVPVFYGDHIHHLYDRMWLPPRCPLS